MMASMEASLPARGWPARDITATYVITDQPPTDNLELHHHISTKD